MIRNFQGGDLVTSGEQFVRGQQATGQGIYHRLRTFLGEYFLDISNGTPWLQSVLGKAPQDAAEVALKQRIITAPNVVAITEFQFGSNAPDRRLSIAASVIDINNAAVQIVLDEDII